MLQTMRKHAGNWMIKILLGAIAIAFALSWGVYNYGEGPARLAVKVNGESIAESRVAEEYAALVEQYRRQFGNQFDQVAPMLNLRQQALDRLVDQILLTQAANQLAVVVSDAEVQAKLATMPVFQRGGRFDMELYRRILARNRLAPADFEAAQRQEIRMQKLSALVAGTAQITPLELKDALSWNLAQVKGVYTMFKPADYLNDVKVTPQAVKEYYEKNKNSYMQPETLTLDYIVFPISEQRDQVEVSDDEVADAYDAKRDQYSKPERVGARHILIKLPKDASEAEDKAAKAKAEEIMALAKKPGADFAELAKKHSQGPTASAGGDLGMFPRGMMVAPFEQLAFTLKPGEVGMVKSPFGWHVVKVYKHEDPSVTPLKEVAGKIKQELVENRARQMAQAAAERAFDNLALDADLTKLAESLKKSVSTSPAISSSRNVEGLPGLEGLFKAAEGLEAGQAVPALPFADGSILAVIKERKPATPKPFKEVEVEAGEALKDRLSLAKAKAEAEKLIKDLTAAKDPAAELAKMPTAAETGWVKQGGSVKDVGQSARLVSALFLRPASAPVIPEPVPSGDDFMVGVLQERKEPDKAQMEAAKADTKDRLLAQQRRQMLDRFLADLRARAEILVPVQGTSESPIPGCDSRTSIEWVPMDKKPLVK